VSQVDQAGRGPGAPGTQRTAPGRRDVVGLIVFTALLAVVFAWAKWDPYWHKIPTVARSGQLGPSVLGSGRQSPAVSWQAGVDFLRTYVLAVWPAVVAGWSRVPACRRSCPADGCSGSSTAPIPPRTGPWPAPSAPWVRRCL
jgi:hypothetical protein